MNESFRRHRAVPAGLILRHAVLLCVGLVLLASCTGNGTGPEVALTYQITEGACGNVVFVESIGTDSATALAAVEARKTEQFGEGAVRLDVYPLQVVDRHGDPPQHRFYAVRVEDAESGMLVHSVAEVITTGGDLFSLQWCPD
jgi:hypothetical protein